MGAIKNLFGGKPKVQPVKPKVATAAPTAPVEDPAVAEEERKKKAALALNAGGGPQGLGDTSTATVTKRNLLGM